MHRLAFSLLATAVVLSAVPAGAEPADTAATVATDSHALTVGGRYQLMEINDKIVRLDTQTGRFELCRMDGADWKCLVAQDERQRLEATISDLAGRVAALEAEQRASARTRQVSVAPASPPVTSATPVATAPVAPAPVSAAPAIAATTQPPARVVTAPIVAEAAPVAASAAGTIPEGPVPAEPVPTGSVLTAPVQGSAGPAATAPVATGKPFDISPTATSSAAAETESPGLIDRLTGLVPNLSW